MSTGTSQGYYEPEEKLLKEGLYIYIYGIRYGNIIGLIKGDARSLDYSLDYIACLRLYKV